MGCQLTISGFTPAAALATAETDVSLGDAQTKGTLRVALESALRRQAPGARNAPIKVINDISGKVKARPGT